MYIYSPHLSVHRLLTICLCLVVGIIPLSTAQAQAADLLFSLRPDPQNTHSSNPGYFVFGSAPGTLVEDRVLVVNTGSEPIDLLLYPADAVTADNGGLTFPAAYGETPQRVGAWLTLSETQVTLKPGEARSIAFTLQIPTGSFGEYADGIIAQPAGQAQVEGQLTVNILQRTAVSVLVTVPGERPFQKSLEIISLQAAPEETGQSILVQLHNTGHLGLRPQGSLTISDKNGERVREIPLQMGYFLAGDQVDYPISLEPPLKSGTYQITLRLDYAAGIAEKSAILDLTEPSITPMVIEFNQPPTAGSPVNGVPLFVVYIAGAVIVLLLVVVFILALRLRRVG